MALQIKFILHARGAPSITDHVPKAFVDFMKANMLLFKFEKDQTMTPESVGTAVAVKPDILAMKDACHGVSRLRNEAFIMVLKDSGLEHDT